MVLWVTVSTEDGDAKEFYRRRVVEIKHGRVAMLACTGHLARGLKRLCLETDTLKSMPFLIRALDYRLALAHLSDVGVA